MTFQGIERIRFRANIVTCVRAFPGIAMGIFANLFYVISGLNEYRFIKCTVLTERKYIISTELA